MAAAQTAAIDQLMADNQAARVRAAMARHPAGKALREAPLWEERIEELTADFAAALIETIHEALS